MRAAAGTAALALSLALALSGCASGEGPSTSEPSPTGAGDSSAGDAPSVVVIGAGPTDQTAVLAHLWADSLREAGAQAEVRRIEGGRDGYLQALREGRIAVYPDYSGEVYLHLREDDLSAPATASPTSGDAAQQAQSLVRGVSELLGVGSREAVTDQDVTEGLREELPEGLTVLEAAAAPNKRSLVTTAPQAAALEVGSIEDLAGDCDALRFGAPAGPDQAPVTARALERSYGCVPESIREFDDPAEISRALVRGEIQVAVLASSDPAIGHHSLKVLTDDHQALVPERLIPVASTELGESQVQAIEAADAELDDAQLGLLTRMMRSSTPYSPREAARYWIEHRQG